MAGYDTDDDRRAAPEGIRDLPPPQPTLGLPGPPLDHELAIRFERERWWHSVEGKDRPRLVMSGTDFVAWITRSQEPGSAIGAFGSGDILTTTVLTIGQSETWTIKPVPPGPPDERIVLGKQFGHKKHPASERVVWLFDPTNTPTASISWPDHQGGSIRLGAKYFKLTPNKKARTGRLGDRLHIEQTSKRRQTEVWVLRPEQPRTRPISLPLAILYWHILAGDHHVKSQ